MGIKRKLALFMVLAMCFSLMPATTFAENHNPQLTKTAEWVDAEAGTAKITLKVQGTPINVKNPGVDVVVVMDYSGSMGICNSTDFTETFAWKNSWGLDYYYYTCEKCRKVYTGYNAPDYCSKDKGSESRWNQSKEALYSALNQIIPSTESPNRVAFVAFDSRVKDEYKTGFTKDKQKITELVGRLDNPQPGNNKGTDYEAGLGQAYSYLNATNIKNNGKAKYVIFLSDGEPNKNKEGYNEIAAIKGLGATVYTIGIELDTSASNILKSYATSGSYHYNVTDLSNLNKVFTGIAKSVSSSVKVTDIVNFDKFDVVSVGTPTSGNASLDPTDLKTVTWNLSNFKTAGDTLEIYIKLNAKNQDKYEQFITNESAGATYVNSSGETVSLAVSSVAPSSEKPMIERTKAKYDVKFYLEDGTTQIETTQSVYKGSAAIAPIAPAKTEPAGYIYTFAGWVPIDAEADYTSADIVNVQKNMNFKATYTAIKDESKWHTVTFLAGEHGSLSGTAMYSDILEGTAWGTAVSTVPTPIADPGYKFDKWDAEFAATINGDLTYTASFVKDESKWHTVTFLAGEHGSLSGTAMYSDILEGTAWGTAVPTVPTPIADPGYKFDNWNAKFAETIDKDLTYTASFVKDESKWHTVTFLAGEHGSLSGTAMYSDILEGTAWGTAVSTVPIPIAEEGYHFADWTPEIPIDSPNVTESKTYTANFVQNATLSITSYQGVYDANDHKIILNEENKEGERFFEYRVDGEDEWSSENPSFIDVGTYTVYVREWSSDEQIIAEGVGTVTIEKRPLTITAGSAGKKYDGTPLTNNSYTVSDTTENSGLLEGHVLKDVTVTGSQTEVGQSPNKASGGKIVMEMTPRKVALTNEIGDLDDYDVTSNYAIEYVDGILTVSKKSNGGSRTLITVTPRLNLEDHYAYVQGYPDGTVRPQGNITREEVAAVFFRLLDPTYRETIRSTEEGYSDVAANKWSVKHIATLSNGSVLDGYPDGTFRPGAYMTKAELAAVASRFDNLSEPGDVKFSDISGHWAESYILSAAAKGWVKGYEDGTYKPDKYVTRDEFVTLVNNVLDRGVATERILPEAKQFSDLISGQWYYEAMQEAINSHNYKRTEDGSEIWSEITYPTVEM